MGAAKNSHFGIHLFTYESHIAGREILIFALRPNLPQHKELILQMGWLKIGSLLKPKVSHEVRFDLPEKMRNKLK